MTIDEIATIHLDTFPTKDVKENYVNGELKVIWRNWDNIIKNPEMIYLNSVNPGEIKGPHIHKIRTSYFLCLQGKMVIVIRDKNGKYHEIEPDSLQSKLISVSKGKILDIIEKGYTLGDRVIRYTKVVVGN